MEQEGTNEVLTISSEEEKIYRETFNSIDKHRREWIPASQIGYALRINGQCPTEKEIEEIIQSAVDENNADEEIRLTYDDFKVIMKQYSKPKSELYSIIDQAFLAFDKTECGLIDETELRKALASLGEILEEAEINELIKDAKAGTDGRIPYADFAKHLVDSYPRPSSKKKSPRKKSGSATRSASRSATKKD